MLNAELAYCEEQLGELQAQLDLMLAVEPINLAAIQTIARRTAEVAARLGATTFAILNHLQAGLTECGSEWRLERHHLKAASINCPKESGATSTTPLR